MNGLIGMYAEWLLINKNEGAQLSEQLILVCI